MRRSVIEATEPAEALPRRWKRQARAEEVVTMTGSSLAPIVIPIVVMFSLAAWIVMVFHAASHPQWRDRSTAVPQNRQPRKIQRVPAVTPGSRTP
jgi:hypothetical protein